MSQAIISSGQADATLPGNRHLVTLVFMLLQLQTVNPFIHEYMDVDMHRD